MGVYISLINLYSFSGVFGFLGKKFSTFDFFNIFLNILFLLLGFLLFFMVYFLLIFSISLRFDCLDSSISDNFSLFDP